ncbi:Hypothetical predicted protein [Octopus vulgaris]|uniref:Uncharacterized protein n=1 Tax=Octopus vulgaris TaxID=6645 RepID=A0AA36BLC1_OCTVU|nr:Hypothetical predicted protein [Octopus vulgaris]
MEIAGREWNGYAVYFRRIQLGNIKHYKYGIDIQSKNFTVGFVQCFQLICPLPPFFLLTCLVSSFRTGVAFSRQLCEEMGRFYCPDGYEASQGSDVRYIPSNSIACCYCGYIIKGKLKKRNVESGSAIFFHVITLYD